MKIGIFTYNAPHRKTHDLVFRLKLLGHNNLTLLVMPFIERGHLPLYQHRPQPQIDISVWEFADKMGLNIELYSTFDDLSVFDKLLIGGAGILSKEYVKYNIINSHPGYLPNVRGLDALKWAIIDEEPIGVTTHFIGEKPDTGILIEKKELILYPTDTFHSIAFRQYDLEIKMLVDALIIKPDGRILTDSFYPVNHRMGKIDEIRMIEKLKKRLTEL